MKLNNYFNLITLNKESLHLVKDINLYIESMSALTKYISGNKNIKFIINIISDCMGCNLIFKKNYQCRHLLRTILDSLIDMAFKKVTFFEIRIAVGWLSVQLNFRLQNLKLLLKNTGGLNVEKN